MCAVEDRKGMEKVRALLAARPDRHSIPLAERRAAMDEMGGGALPAHVEVQEIRLGGVRCERINASPAAAGSVLYVHGGAYVAGSPRSHRGLGVALARATGAGVFLLDYGLAPERPFPAAVLDVAAACREMSGNPGAFGPFALAGDSAGAGALISALTLLRDSCEPLPRAAACISPWLDLSCSFDSYKRLADADPFLTERGLLQDAATYLAGADAKNPLASPVFADPAGLPPLFIQAGSDEVLLDEIRAFTEAAKAAGCEVTLQVWSGMIHVFHAFRSLLPEAELATRELADFLSGKLR